MSFEPKNVSLDEMSSFYEHIKKSLYIACILCGTEFEQYIPGRVWIYIFSFLEKRYQSEHEIFDKESTEYDCMRNPHGPASLNRFYYKQRYANFILKIIIDFHGFNYRYALSHIPLFEVPNSLNPSKSKMKSAVRRQIVESLLPTFLEIFEDQSYTGSSVISKNSKKEINGAACKKLIIDESTPYMKKLDAMNSLISVFNNIEYLKSNNPYVTQGYTFIYINGLHTPIPLPLTLEIYLGLAQHL